MALSNEKLVSKLKWKAMNDFPFLTGIISKTQTLINDKLEKDGTEQLALTTGDEIHISRNVFDMLSFKDLYFIYMHEIMHIVLMHVPRYAELMGNGLDKKWCAMHNILADLRVNKLLMDEGVYPDKLTDDLVSKNNIIPTLNKNGFEKKDGVDKFTSEFFDAIAQDNEISSDRAFSLGRSIFEIKGQQQQSQNPQFNGNDISPQTSQKQGQGSKTPTPAQYKKMAKKIRQKIKDNMIQNIVGSKMRGDERTSLSELLENLYMRNKLNWGKIIRNSLMKGLRRQIDNNSIHRKAIASGFKFSIPAFKNKPGLYHLALAIDTSGSMDTEELKEIASEILGLKKHYKVQIDLFLADNEVQMIENDIKTVPQLLKKLKKVYGRGGTSFVPVFDKIRELRNKKERKYKSLVYFTDGYADQDCLTKIKGLNVWWILTEKGEKNKDTFPFGKVVVLK